MATTKTNPVRAWTIQKYGYLIPWYTRATRRDAIAAYENDGYNYELSRLQDGALAVKIIITPVHK